MWLIKACCPAVTDECRYFVRGIYRAADKIFQQYHRHTYVGIYSCYVFPVIDIRKRFKRPDSYRYRGSDRSTSRALLSIVNFIHL